MRPILELLRLDTEQHRGVRQIAASLGSARSTVADYLRRFREPGLPWPLPADLDEVGLEAEGLVGVSRRRKVRTTRRAPGNQSSPDLVQRNFTATAPNQLWVADITYVPTWAGFLYLAIVLDARSRRIVGWALGLHLRTELVLDALNMVLTQRRPSGVIYHSDHGSIRRSPLGREGSRRLS